MHAGPRVCLTLIMHACRASSVPVPALEYRLSEEPAQQLLEPCKTLPAEPVEPFLEPCSLLSDEPAQRTLQPCNILSEESAEHFLEPCNLLSEETTEQTLQPCSFMSQHEPRVRTATIPSFCLHESPRHPGHCKCMSMWLFCLHRWQHIWHQSIVEQFTCCSVEFQDTHCPRNSSALSRLWVAVSLLASLQKCS